MTLHFPTASSNTFFSLGGYTCVRPGAWRQHLIRLAGGRLAAPQPEQNDCVLRSLEEAGAIRFDRHRIVIVDEDLLQGLAYV